MWTAYFEDGLDLGLIKLIMQLGYCVQMLFVEQNFPGTCRHPALYGMPEMLQQKKIIRGRQCKVSLTSPSLLSTTQHKRPLYPQSELRNPVSNKNNLNVYLHLQ
ncbi:hypothetical protein XENOCAPTIV_017922 [Xenoophorus captivus]|uniref:Uncharacterized protein n=1 Tax=Xenoophorus captivus TaxID=1517983 RepID=A0ABV0QVU0_9TELE